MKYKRQNKIIEIVKSMPVHTHDELISILKSEGFNVTQATVSRDIKELGLIKVPAQDGSSVYSAPQTNEDGKQKARYDMLQDSIRDVRSAMHTVVIHTYPGMASAVAAAIDNSMKEDILGSIAGDDCVFIVTESTAHATDLSDKIKKLCGAE